MRRFFIVLFVFSLLATAGTYYWRTYMPEGEVIAFAPQAETRSFQERAPGGAPEGSAGRLVLQEPSERQDLAVTISIVSSIISALAAIAQTWITARAFRR